MTIDCPRDIYFSTSGHSGDSLKWLRTRAQLVDEVHKVVDACSMAFESVVCFAPPNHLFGYLFGTVLPEEFRLPVQQCWRNTLELPRIRRGERPLFICLPSSWQLLRHMTASLANLPHVNFLHATAPTTCGTHDLLSQLPAASTKAYELFGSTETGAVAYRRITATPPAGSEPWTPLSDVTITTSGVAGLLTLCSPRLARVPGTDSPPDSITLSDIVRPQPGGFVFVGRSSRLLKINGRRCHLDHVEALFRRTRPAADVACLPVQDPVRGENYEIFHTDRGPSDDLWRDLAGVLDDTPGPRALHPVPSIPRTSTGKVRSAELTVGIKAGGDL